MHLALTLWSVVVVLALLIALPVIEFLYQAWKWGREHDDEQNT